MEERTGDGSQKAERRIREKRGMREWSGEKGGKEGELGGEKMQVQAKTSSTH